MRGSTRARYKCFFDVGRGRVRREGTSDEVKSTIGLPEYFLNMRRPREIRSKKDTKIFPSIFDVYFSPTK